MLQNGPMGLVGSRILAVVFVALAFPALGQTSNEAGGRVTAFVCEALPSPLKVEIEIETLEDSPRSARLRRALLKSLAARDAVVVSGAPLRLSLYVSPTREAETRRERDLARISRGNASDKRTEFHINLWSNRRDSVLGGRREEVLSSAVDELQVEIILDSKSSGQCVWQGEAVHVLGGRDELVVAEKIIPLLMQRLGRSARAEPIELD